MRASRTFSALLAIAALSGCSSQKDEAAPSPDSKLVPYTPPTAAANGALLTAGTWTVEEAAGGVSAVFGEAGAKPSLILACDRNTRALTLALAGAAAQTVRLESGGLKADLAMAPAGDGQLKAALNPAHPILRTWSEPAGVIEIAAPGAERLRLPGHLGIRRLVTACE